MTDKKSRLTVEQRVMIIERLKNGESASHLATEYGVTQSTISKAKKNKEKILATKRHMDERQMSTTKKKYTGIQESALEIGLYKWYVQKRSLGHTVSGPTLREKALLFNSMLDGSPNFKASTGWLNRFKIRHSIRELSVPNENSCDEPSSDEFIADFAQFVTTNGIDLNLIYNADETVFSWKKLPNEALNSYFGCKNEDRVTLIACSNASGTHKIPLLIVGNSENTGTLDEVTSLSVAYRSRKNGWVDEELFMEWYTNIFLPAIAEQHGTLAKCLLLLDNASVHPPAEILDAISTISTVTYLPRNVNAKVQPIRSIAETMTNVYKENLVRRILQDKSSLEAGDFFKTWTLFNFFDAIVDAWNSVNEFTIKNAWKNLLQDTVDPLYNQALEPYMFLPLLQRLPKGAKTTIEETAMWLKQEEIEPGWKILNDTEILFEKVKKERSDKPAIIETKEIIVKIPAPVEKISERVVDIPDPTAVEITESVVKNEEHIIGIDCPISPEEALRGIEIFEKWFQTRWQCSTNDAKILQQFKNIAETEVLSTRLNMYSATIHKP